MLSNQIIQNTIDEIKNITHVDTCVMDIEGQTVSTTFEQSESYEQSVLLFVDSQADSQEVQGVHFFKVFVENHLEYVVIVKGDSENVYMVGKIIVYQLQELVVAYKERFDKDSFVKNLLLDNLLLVDIYNRAKKLHIAHNARRGVFLITAVRAGKEEIDKSDNNVLEIVKSLFASKNRDYITAVDERSIVVIKELNESEGYEDLNKVAHVILDMLNTEAMLNVRVSYGTIVNDLKEVSRSYKEAKLALEVGNIFYSDKHVVAYNNLGIGRLIYQLPVQLCRMFIQENFNGYLADDFDEETLMTIAKFFENNLNISETSRQLYIHRNTLVYRLDKLQKVTGLDIRVFDDAITFKIAIMVSKYMKYMENNNY
ncbi:MAG: PucR family transcriptional regulator [Lachnospiraceae bacterium]|nr:PucR family transcriptional regulator [Lachnospiraceae bacterium]